VQPASSERELPAPGSVIAGKYELVSVIGEGGMGVVYEARHLRLKQRVAIKMLRPKVLHLDAITPRFEREARTAALLRGRHVARIFDVDVTEGGLPFMVMEFLVGRDLEAELVERGTLSVQEATGYVLQACVAMQEAHAAGIVHRDLKPANLFLTEENGERVVKVLDFGISKITDDAETRLTGTFATVGTPLYMSPEQVRSSKDVDIRTDIWSLAVILFEALAGQPPFYGSMTATAAAIVADPTPSLCAIRPDVPVELEQALERALQKLPSRRFPDVGSLSAALAPFGPPRLPFSSLNDASNPVLPPSSGPSLSARIVPPGSAGRISDSKTVAETIMIPRSEEAQRRALRRRTGGAAALLGVVVILGALGALRLRSSTATADVLAPPALLAAASAPGVGAVAAQPLPPAEVPSSAAPTTGPPPEAVPVATAPPEPPVRGRLPVRPVSPPGYARLAPPLRSTASMVRPPTVSPSAAASPPPPPANPIFLQ